MNAYGQNILQLLPADSLQFFNQAHKISVLLMEEILHQKAYTWNLALLI